MKTNRNVLRGFPAPLFELAPHRPFFVRSRKWAGVGLVAGVSCGPLPYRRYRACQY